MKPLYTIGQLARATGIPTSTVRYYERVGLLRPSGRTSGNYRVYDAEALARVRFIRAAQATGFALAELTVLCKLWDGTTAGCQAVQTRLEKLLSDVEQRMAAVRQVRSVLKAALARCRRSNQG
jgi:MerR family mercuric resistance operon transcriptional regulator